MQDGTGTANTAMAFHNKQLLALNEQDLPHAVRPAGPRRRAREGPCTALLSSRKCRGRGCAHMQLPVATTNSTVRRCWAPQASCSAWAQIRVHGDAHVETLERVTYGGRLAGYFTAHPKKDPATGAPAPGPRDAC